MSHYSSVLKVQELKPMVESHSARQLPTKSPPLSLDKKLDLITIRPPMPLPAGYL